MRGSTGYVCARLFVLIITSAALGACGGGGSGPPPNRPPVANAGADQAVVEGNAVTLDAGASSDSDGSISSYSWTQTGGTTVAIDGADSVSATFDPPLTDVAYELVFEVTVTDNEGATATSTTTVTINPSQAPSVSAGADQDVVETTLVSLAATISDADGSIQSVEWRQVAGPPVTLSDPAVENPTFSAPIADVDTNLEFEVTAVDSTNDSAADTLLVIVHPNQPPSVSAGADQEVVESTIVVLDATIGDPDGTIASIAWQQIAGPDVVLSDTTIEDPAFTAPAVTVTTDVAFEVMAVDAIGDASADTVIATIHPNEPPTVTVDFPCAGCRLYGDTISVTGVAGTGADDSFVAALDRLTSITVDAGAGPVNALVQADNRWIAQNVPIPTSSAISLTVTAEDAFAETTDLVQAQDHRPTLGIVKLAVDPAATGGYFIFEDFGITQRLLRLDVTTGDFELLHEDREQTQPLLGQVGGISVDPADSRVLISVIQNGLHAIDPATGLIEAVSGPTRGTGPTISEWLVADLDADDRRMIVYDGTTQSLYEVDIASGDRVLIVDNSATTSGDPFIGPTAISIDDANDLAYLVEPFDDYLQVDLGTGFRTTLARSGVSTLALSSVEFDSTLSSLFATDFSQDQVIEIDPVTGNRSVLSGPPSDPDLRTGAARDIFADPFLGELVVSDFADFQQPDTDQLISVDKQTGIRQVLYKDSIGTGPSIRDTAIIDLDQNANVVYAASQLDDSIYRIELAGGTRSLVTSNSVGTGAAIGSIVAIVVNPTDANLLLLDRENDRLSSVDTSTGNRVIVSDALVGSGVDFIDPVAMALDDETQTAYVVDMGHEAVLRVDLATGAREISSGPGASGITLVEITDAVFDRAGNQLLLTDHGSGATTSLAVIAVDLATGERRILSSRGLGVGVGPDWVSLRSLDLVEALGAVVVSTGSGIMLVDLSSGDRSIVATQDTGSGEALLNLLSARYDPGRRVVYGWGVNYEALYAISLVTGDRVIVSK